MTIRTGFHEGPNIIRKFLHKSISLGYLSSAASDAALASAHRIVIVDDLMASLIGPQCNRIGPGGKQNRNLYVE